MIRVCLFFALVGAVLSVPVSEPFSDCDGTANVKPFWSGEPTLVKSVPNGKLFVVNADGVTNVSVVHLFGSPREKGVAHGLLLKDEILQLYSEFYQYVSQNVDQWATKYKVPNVIRKALDKFGGPAVLEMSWKLLEPYTPSYFIEELEGLAEGLGISASEVFQIHAMPEVIKASCSMFSAANEATAETNGGGLTVLRALDWGLDTPFRKYPAVLVYHSDDAPTKSDLATLTWAGFLGALTGYSGRMAVTEKLWFNERPLEIWAVGIPFHFLMRDILEFDTTLAEADARIRAAKKTAGIYLGTASRADNAFTVHEYGINTDNVFNDTTPFPGFKPQAEQHPFIKSVVYIDKHTQPSDSWCMAKELQRRYGAIDATAAKELCSLMQTGDIHLAVSDFAANDFYVSVASANVDGDVIKAYDNVWLRFNMTREFGRTL